MKVFEIGASVAIKLDTGYAPYMRYLETLSGRGPAFGTRENSQSEVTLWAKAAIDEGENPDEAMGELVKRLDTQVRAHLASMFPDVGFEKADEYAYTEVKTAVNPEGDPHDW